MAPEAGQRWQCLAAVRAVISRNLSNVGEFVNILAAFLAIFLAFFSHFILAFFHFVISFHFGEKSKINSQKYSHKHGTPLQNTTFHNTRLGSHRRAARRLSGAAPPIVGVYGGRPPRGPRPRGPRRGPAEAAADEGKGFSRKPGCFRRREPAPGAAMLLLGRGGSLLGGGPPGMRPGVEINVSCQTESLHVLQHALTVVLSSSTIFCRI